MRLLLLALLTVVSVPSLPGASARAIVAREPSSAAAGYLPGPAYVDGEVLLKLRTEDGAKQDGRLGFRATEIARALDLELVESPALARVGSYKLRTRAGEDAAAAVARLQALPDVEYAERNALFYPASVPTDPLYQGVDNIETDLQRWMFNGSGENRVLNAEAAWDVTKGSSKVVIAVIDSGTKTDDPSIATLWVNKREQPGNGIDDDRNGYVDDVNGYDFFNKRGDIRPEIGDGIDNNTDGRADETTSHGTVIASLIGAGHDDGIGMAGAAPGCPIMTIKVFGDETGVAADGLVESIHYAVDNGATIINMSLVSFVNSKSVRDATDYAAERNIVLVAAAGNSNAGYLQYPATYSTVIGVGGSAGGFDGDVRHGLAERRWPRSQFGASVDVVAPAVVLGATIVSTGRHLEDPTLELGATSYEIVSGTSFAAPLVTAASGLAIARDIEIHGDRTLSNNDIQTLLKLTAQPLSNDPYDSPDAGFSWAGAGRVDYARALAKIPGSGDPNPVVASTLYNKKLLRISGDGFSQESRVEVNGKLLTQPVTFTFAVGTLGLRGSRKALNLQKHSVNQIVVIERGVRSPVYEFGL